MLRAMVLAACLVAAAGQALAQDWQTRHVCDLRKPGANRAADCARLGAEVLTLLAEKAGTENWAVIADFSENLVKAKAGWDNPCPEQGRCPDHAYTIRYALVPKKMLPIPKDKTFTALVCREGFSETAPEESACRAKLIRVVRELAVRARQENAQLALIKCSGQQPGSVVPDNGRNGRAALAGYEVIYAFVRMPDMLPYAGNDPKAAARQVAATLAGPAEEAPRAKAQAANAQQPAGQPQSRQTAASQPEARPQAAVQQPASRQAQPESQPQPTAPQAQPGPVTVFGPLKPGEVVLQVAALPGLAQAEAMADSLSVKGVDAAFEEGQAGGKTVYRVLAKAKSDPEAFRKRLEKLGYPGAIQRR